MESSDRIWRQALATRIDRGSMPAIHGVLRCRLSDLGQWLWEEFRVPVPIPTLSRAVRAIVSIGVQAGQ